MYLIDTNAISEARKGTRANPGVAAFFNEAAAASTPLYISSITIGEIRRGIELIRYRGDRLQGDRLEAWLDIVILQYRQNILSFDADAAQVWGFLRVPHAEHELDKQIAAIALIHDLTVVTRNTNDFTGTGVRTFNPFQSSSP